MEKHFVQTCHSVQIWKVHTGVVVVMATLETAQFVMVRNDVVMYE